MKYFNRNTVAERKRVYEDIDPHSETEQAGYIPPQIQIENMILAGQRLDQSRKALYDFASEDEIDEDATDPTRSGNFDLADATQMAMLAESSLSDQADKADKARKASQTAQEAQRAADKGSGEPEPVKGA